MALPKPVPGSNTSSSIRRNGLPCCRRAFRRRGAVEREQRGTANDERSAGRVVTPGVEVEPQKQHDERNRNEDEQEPDPGRAIVGPRQRLGSRLQRGGLALQPLDLIDRFTANHLLRRRPEGGVRCWFAFCQRPVSMLTGHPSLAFPRPAVLPRRIRGHRLKRIFAAAKWLDCWD